MSKRSGSIFSSIELRLEFYNSLCTDCGSFTKFVCKICGVCCCYHTAQRDALREAQKEGTRDGENLT